MSAPGHLPLLAARDLAAPLAWRAGHPISGQAYLADVQQLAARLPPAGRAVNLCADRYAFAVALGAALLRAQPSLLPPDTRPDTLASLQQAGGHTYALVDGSTAALTALPSISVTAGGVGGALAQMPEIPAALHAASLLTSGSTGTPQPHAKRWQTLVGDVAAAVPRLTTMLGREALAGLTLVATVPVQHSYGLESSVLLALQGGAAFDSGRPYFPADIAQALASVPAPRALVTTPFHLKTLLASGIELPPLALILSATAPLSPQLAAQAEQQTGAVLVEIYGSTETGQIATRRTTETEIWHTLGRVQVHAEGGDEVQYVAQGDFLQAPTPLADVLELQDANHFRLLGRANDLIHVAGKRSSLSHLNYHLNSIPGVEDGAFWLPDEQADGVVRPVALVVAPTLSAAQIVGQLRVRLESVFVPRRVLHVAALPREGTGKLTVRALREFALAHLTADGAPVELFWTVPLEHPVFAGHFPGQPLLPGALLIAQLLQLALTVPALAARLGPTPQLASAKFLSPARPGARLSFQLRPDAGSSIAFDIHAGNTLIATGRWTGQPAPAAGEAS